LPEKWEKVIVSDGKYFEKDIITHVLGFSVSFEEFLQKKNVYFREILNYIFFKIFSIANYNFLPLFWQ